MDGERNTNLHWVFNWGAPPYSHRRIAKHQTNRCDKISTHMQNVPPWLHISGNSVLNSYRLTARFWAAGRRMIWRTRSRGTRTLGSTWLHSLQNNTPQTYHNHQMLQFCLAVFNMCCKVDIFRLFNKYLLTNLNKKKSNVCWSTNKIFYFRKIAILFFK